MGNFLVGGKEGSFCEKFLQVGVLFSAVILPMLPTDIFEDEISQVISAGI